MNAMKYLFASALLCASTMLQARNTVQTVKQVNESVSLETDVDYVIDDATPFGDMGSVNIENTEHAVLIIKSIRPSVVISKWLKNHVYIKGEQAVDGRNCQVKMYNRGAIVFPYSSTFRPLTCYTEANYEGTEYNGYTEGSSGGFMKTLSAAALNNRIQSFKLKRGYMVTFAVGQGGWGYSRCFIADQEDLEIPVMPDPFKGTISSYRLFKWQNASKAGVHDTSRSANIALGTTSCFDWGQGNSSLLPDVEWVAHHIYEDWPSAATCGGVDGTCHMKTNNEPGNSSDDHPQDVETVLNNWQNLMRTGMRLCSESSHDGSMNHLKTFIEEIDKRGWRCDILDLHCYWDGQWNSLDWYIQEYGKGRPCWISEWVWGSSWGNAGAFAEGRRSDDATYNGTVPILEKLNSNPRVERYFYWNSEQWYTKIWRDGALTKLGQYYANMNVPQGYNAQYDYVPKIVCSAPTSITGTYSKAKKTYKVEWTDPNGDMLNTMELQRQNPGSTRWVTVSTIELKDKTDRGDVSYAYTDTIAEPGLYSYRVYTQDPAKKSKFYSDEVSVTVSAANSVGTLGYGRLNIASTDDIETEFEARQDSTGADAAPAVFMGMCSYKNKTNGISNHLLSVGKTSFKFRLYPWTLATPVAISSTETVDYMLLPFGTYTMPDESQFIVEKVGAVKGDTVQVVFTTPFPEGTTPVVVVQNNSTSKTVAPTVVRVFDITNQGFRAVLTRQEKATGTFSGQNTNYMAALPGTYQIGEGKLMSVYRDASTPVGGSTYQAVALRDAEGESMHLVNPYLVGGSQTFNYASTAVYRQQSLQSEDFTVGEQTYSGAYGVRVMRQIDGTTTNSVKNNASANGDYMGWFILSDDLAAVGTEPDVFVSTPVSAIRGAESFTVSAYQGSLYCNDGRARAYTIDGARVPMGSRLPAGVYIVTNGKQSTRVLIK